jgi:NADPH2:quinone reductase
MENARLSLAERTGENANAKKSILIIGGAGGVGTMAIQIAKKVLQFGQVLATASRPESENWCRKFGADHVIGHRNIKEELNHKGLKYVDYVFVTTDLNTVWPDVIAVVKPTGTVIGITAFRDLNMELAFQKRITVIPELMFARSMLNEEPEKQGRILNTLAELLDKGTIKHTMNHQFEWSQLREAQALQESGKAIGKITLAVRF